MIKKFFPCCANDGCSPGLLCRIGKRLVGRIHLCLCYDGHHGHCNPRSPKLILHSLLKHIPDLPLRHGAEHVERLFGDMILGRLLLNEQRADMGAVPVRKDDMVPRRKQCHNLWSDTIYVAVLLHKRPMLMRLFYGVSAKRDYNS